MYMHTPMYVYTHMYTSMYTYVYTQICICTQPENLFMRIRIYTYVYTQSFTSICMYYLCIYIGRNTERERERESARARAPLLWASAHDFGWFFASGFQVYNTLYT